MCWAVSYLKPSVVLIIILTVPINENCYSNFDLYLLYKGFLTSKFFFSLMIKFCLIFLLQSASQTYNWSDFTHLVIRMRGDGRTYGLGLQKNYKRTHRLDFAMGLTANDQFHYPMFTRGGPYWQTVKVPSHMDHLS